MEKLKKYLSRELGSEKKNLQTEILNEIKNSCESLSDIISQKGFKEWFVSIFSSTKFLGNVIDMIIQTFKQKKIGLNINVIKDKIEEYLVGNSIKINNWIYCVTLQFNEEEKKKWNDLCKSYEKTREKIIKLKD